MLGNLDGLKVLDLVSDEDWIQLLGSLVFSIVVGFLAYSRERVNEAKKEEERHDIGPRVTSYQEDYDRDYPRVPGREPPPY